MRKNVAYINCEILIYRSEMFHANLKEENTKSPGLKYVYVVKISRQNRENDDVHLFIYIESLRLAIWHAHS